MSGPNDPVFVPDVGAFLAAFPIWTNTDPIFVAATLARASRNISARVWGNQYLDGVWLLASHWLTVDPMGTSTALKANARSTYGDQFDDMKRGVVGGGFGVSCGGGVMPSGGPGDGGGWLGGGGGP